MPRRRAQLAGGRPSRPRSRPGAGCVLGRPASSLGRGATRPDAHPLADQDREAGGEGGAVRLVLGDPAPELGVALLGGDRLETMSARLAFASSACSSPRTCASAAASRHSSATWLASRAPGASLPDLHLPRRALRRSRSSAVVRDRAASPSIAAATSASTTPASTASRPRPKVPRRADTTVAPSSTLPRSVQELAPASPWRQYLEDRSSESVACDQPVPAAPLAARASLRSRGRSGRAASRSERSRPPMSGPEKCSRAWSAAATSSASSRSRSSRARAPRISERDCVATASCFAAVASRSARMASPPTSRNAAARAA